MDSINPVTPTDGGMNLTQWFKGSVKPVHVGVYERYLRHRFALWNGSRWCIGEYTPDDAARVRHRSAIQNARWRGLASDPKATP